MHSGKKVTVLGLGKSGFEAALFLKRRGYQVFVSESADNESVRNFKAKLDQAGIASEMGAHTHSQILDSDWVLISPGIPPASPVFCSLIEAKKPVYSEIEVASWFSKASKIIAVTGTSGKTTVTTLLARVLEAQGKSVVCCGNIGNPWIGEVERIDNQTFVVLELSSFQLQQCFEFRPDVGVLLNISPNHLDWHPNMEEYISAKLRIFQNQKKSDFAVIRSEDRKKLFPSFPFAGSLVFFDENPVVNPNEAVVRRVASILDVDPDCVDKVLTGFQGLEHRLETVLVHEGVQYINDSKATTTAALAWALEKFSDKSVHLIAGGIPKSRDYETIKELVGRKAARVYLIGKAASLLSAAWQNSAPCEIAEDFRRAVESAVKNARAGETVLLSPACSSFDMFKSYQDRGRCFKDLVKSFVNEKTQDLRTSPQPSSTTD